MPDELCVSRWIVGSPPALPRDQGSASCSSYTKLCLGSALLANPALHPVTPRTSMYSANVCARCCTCRASRAAPMAAASAPSSATWRRATWSSSTAAPRWFSCVSMYLTVPRTAGGQGLYPGTCHYCHGLIGICMAEQGAHLQAGIVHAKHDAPTGSRHSCPLSCGRSCLQTVTPAVSVSYGRRIRKSATMLPTADVGTGDAGGPLPH
jgi:hypothetical protein